MMAPEGGFVMRTEPAIRRNDHLEVPGPPAPARARRPSALIVALVTVSALFVVATGVAVWRSTEVTDRDAEIVTLGAQRDAALADAAANGDRADALTARIDRLEARRAEVAGEADALAAKLTRTRATLERMIGPALADGRHFVYVAAVGASQQPPRLVVDVAQWFTDRAAVQAAIEDGILPAGSTSIENGYYVRNADPRWRIVEVAPATPVELVVYPFGDIEHPRAVSMDRFEDLFGQDPHAAIRAFPYWLTVDDATITEVTQQFIP
jgi:hypothetical protein